MLRLVFVKTSKKDHIPVLFYYHFRVSAGFMKNNLRLFQDPFKTK